MKIARIRELSRIEGNLRADGYEFVATIVSNDNTKLLISIPIKKQDIKRITDYWSCPKVLIRRS